MTMIEKIDAAANAIREACGEAEIGLILGSGLAGSISLENEKTIAYQDIPEGTEVDKGTTITVEFTTGGTSD